MALSTIFVVYCPRCGKRFRGIVSRIATMAKMERHLKLAHPDYYEDFYKD